MPIDRSIAARGFALMFTFVLFACSGSGGRAGTTMHLTVVDEGGAVVGFQLLGATGTGSVQLIGDLVETGNGTWRGDATGSTDHEFTTSVLGTTCDTEVQGTQQLEVVGTRGTYGAGLDFRLELTPKSPPQYKAPDTCNTLPPTKAQNGIEWLQFFYSDWRDGLNVHLPDRPGGTWKKDASAVCGTGGSGPPVACARTTTLTVAYEEPSGT